LVSREEALPLEALDDDLFDKHLADNAVKAAA
jgi:hypothetical protein